MNFKKILYYIIQDYFQSASDALFEATKHVSGRYFGEVTILLPLHWPEVNITAATTESSDRATFSIEPDNSEWGSNPHTIRVVGDCGSPGKVTILPETFTNDRSEAEKYGSNIGKRMLLRILYFEFLIIFQFSYQFQ